jgi:glycosyltransferase involved in cell wall biosynthesis
MAVVERLVFARAARVVAVSEFSARQIRSRAPAGARKVRVIPTGVDSGFFTPPADRPPVRAGAGAAEGQVLLLGVGRLAPVKQLHRLVTALARVRAVGVDARLVIAGDGPERPRLERLADDLGVRAYLDLPGFCDAPALRALMRAADLQVCSSAFENFSLAILEGMACGTPVLGTPGGGTPELVGAVDASLVLPDDTADSIASGILGAVADRARLRALGERARALVVDRYDWERIVDRLEALVDEVSRA